MKCIKCGYENPSCNQFCEDCGNQLNQPSSNVPTALDNAIICPSCRNQNPSGSAFCETCGTTLPNMVKPAANPLQVYPQPQTQKIQSSLVLPDKSELAIDSKISIGRLELARYIDPEEKVRWVSRQHFDIFEENGAYYISDEQSANGTKLNGQEIRQQGKQPLKDKDEIIVGEAIKLVFKLNA